MNRNNIKFIENEALERKINIDLFNELISLISETSSKSSNDTLNYIKEKCIWFRKKEIQNMCDVEYFGELLERYEQKIGNDIKDIRAISLALAYSKDLVTDNMIVGTQLVDFINKIKNLANDDIYLQGALYLYDNKKYFQYEKELLNRKYTNTEDIFFVLSLFDNIEERFYILKEQIISLLGINKTLVAINNIKLYGWIINTLYKIIRKYRKKDIILLKTLIVLPTKLINEGSETYKILYDNGYTTEEIAYLNYGLLHYSSIHKTVRLGNSITEERIAINFCKTVINSPNSHNQSVYELIKSMFDEYRKFNIKCEGKEGLKQAVETKVNIINPITFFEFYHIFYEEIFTFDILDEKWDILVQKMDISEYEQIFNSFINYNNFSKEKLEKCIQRYNELTNTSYLDSFFYFTYGKEEIFTQLVNKNIISLKEYYETYEKQEETDNKEIEYLKRYVSGIHYKNAFLFLKYILEDREYSIENTDNFGFNLIEIYNKIRYSYYREGGLKIYKDFLSNEERKMLFFWLDNYMFKVHPNDYIEFIVDSLRDDNIKDIIPTEQLREIYFTLIKIDEELGKDEELRNKYLTQEELQDIINREKAEKEQQRIKKIIEKQEKVISEFNELSKQSFKELYDFCYKYKWIDEEWKICSEIVKSYLYENIEDFKVDKDEIIEFINLFKILIDKNTIDVSEFKEYILRYIKEEELDNAIIKRTC